MPKETFSNLPLEKQEKIMRSSIHEFLNHGFEKGNIGNIAKSAGVAKGSMYQYFENKKELFLYCVKWSTELLLQKNEQYITLKDKTMNVFDFLYQNTKISWLQIKEERELVIFMQDIFLGKYSGLTDESMSYITGFANEHLLNLIQDGKNNGSIRTDIDDTMISLFLTGVSFKIKEYIMNRARNLGEDIVDEDFEVFEEEINALLELLKNGMGGKQ
ncbi:TetR family transcriptional regulator [Anaerocolumna sedimenticola]|uniref:TetR family transcriptional regulator n=1 Tax=Anaerocolumna sedimenticola TaxID=2696063 RepID=A0A6P1TI32_9FIRM|nr:TetR/AcrR family transcriptional regulator [Anaerocolumna sedimenticola]QHQ59759.1 TetR family transcriptional regulator [Anaerocolumna sedimenticola]